MTEHDPDTTPATAAARYAAWNWLVLPVHTPSPDGCSCGHPACTNRGKHPRLRRGVHQASADSDRVAAWWARWPDANVAIATGTLAVIDVDGERGARALGELQAEHGALPATLSVATARGQHLYFHAGDLDVRNSAGRLGPGLDVRGRGGYAIAPPSRHATGHHYRWHDLDQPIAPLPTWLATLQAPPQPSHHPLDVSPARVSQYVQAALDGELHRIATAAPHTRNDSVNRAAFRLGQLAGAGLASPEALRTPLVEAARAVGQGEREAFATVDSGLSAGLAHPRSVQSPS